VKSGAQKDKLEQSGQEVFNVALDYTFNLKIAGFDWDDGNWPKCGKHGVSREEIEYVLLNEPVIRVDPYPHEQRMRAIGKTAIGRYVFLVFVFRGMGGRMKLRPVSARYMHLKEVSNHARTI